MCQNMKTNNELVLCQTMPNNPNKSIYDRFFFQKQMREKGETKITSQRF